VFGLQPLLHVGAVTFSLFVDSLIFLLTRIGFQVGSEVLQERDFLL